MVLSKNLFLIFILTILLLSEICEAKKRRGLYKKKYRNSPRISATFRTVPYKKSSSRRRGFNAPQKRYDNMIEERFILPLEWPLSPSSSYPNAFLPSTTYPRWYSPSASFSSLRRYDLPTPPPFYATSTYPLRRSDDFDTSFLPITAGPLIDLRAFRSDFIRN